MDHTSKDEHGVVTQSLSDSVTQLLSGGRGQAPMGRHARGGHRPNTIVAVSEKQLDIHTVVLTNKFKAFSLKYSYRSLQGEK